jgi:hypothetical protein
MNELELTHGSHPREPSSNTKWRLVLSSSQTKKKEKKGVELEQELLIQDWLVYTLSYKIKKRKKDFVRCVGGVSLRCLNQVLKTIRME